MRIALSCRELAVDRLTGDGARVFTRAQALARAGHELFLLSEELSPPRRRLLRSPGSPRWVPVSPARPDHHYFAEAHRYADRVLDTLRTLVPLDIVEFLNAGAEGLSTIRARRLLGEFPATTIAVARCPWATIDDDPAANRPLTVADRFTAFAERYCTEHADVAHAVEVPVETPVGSSPRGWTSPREVWRLGAYRPAAGIDTFLAAAGLILDADPYVRFVLRGEDTFTDPLGRSYRDHLRRDLPERLRRAVTLGGPMRTGRPPGRCARRAEGSRRAVAACRCPQRSTGAPGWPPGC